MARTIEQILADDPKFKQFLEINLEILSNISKVRYGVINNLPIKEGKLLWKKQEITISGNE